MSKPSTEQESLFRMLVSDLICCRDACSEEKEISLINFLNQAEYFYDVFCESVYILMTDDSVDTLSVDNTGYSRFDTIVLEDDFYAGFELLTKEDIKPGVDDLIVYVDLALMRMKKRLRNQSNVSIVVSTL